MLIRPLLTVAALAVTLTACGAGDTEPTPTPTVTVTAEPEVREVPVAPAACIEALDLAQEAFGDAGTMIGLVPGLLDLIPQAYDAGASGGDASGIVQKLEEANATIGPLADDIDPEPFQAANAECRRAAGEGA